MAVMLQSKNYNAIPGTKLCRNCYVAWKGMTDTDAEERADDDAPVLVVEEMFLALLVSLVSFTCIVRLYNTGTLCSCNSIILKHKYDYNIHKFGILIFLPHILHT